MGACSEFLNVFDLRSKHLLLKDPGQVFSCRDPWIKSGEEKTSLDHGPIVVFCVLQEVIELFFCKLALGKQLATRGAHLIVRCWSPRDHFFLLYLHLYGARFGL